MDRDTVVRDALKRRKEELERKLPHRSGENASEIRATIDLLDAEIAGLEGE